MIYPKSIATLIEQFQKFPSVGPKSAQRMAFQVLKMPVSEVEKFANAIIEAKIYDADLQQDVWKETSVATNVELRERTDDKELAKAEAEIK